MILAAVKEYIIKWQLPERIDLSVKGSGEVLEVVETREQFTVFNKNY